MVSGALMLAERSVRSVITLHADLSRVNIEDDANTLQKQIFEAPHSYSPVCRGQLDDVIGVARGKDLIGDLLKSGTIDVESSLRRPIIVHESIGILQLMGTLRDPRGQLVLVADEYGSFLGVVTPIDILEAIAGKFPD